MNIHWTKIRKWTLFMWVYRTRKQLFCICPAFIMLTVSLTLFFISSVLSLNIPLESVAKVQHDPEARASSNATTCPACLLAKSSSTIQSKFPWLFNNDNTRFHTVSWMKEKPYSTFKNYSNLPFTKENFWNISFDINYMKWYCYLEKCIYREKF